MTKKELISLLEEMPDDSIICTSDSYGAFHEYQHFDFSFCKDKVSVDGKPVWYYVLGTNGDEEGYEGEWKEGVVREYPQYSEKALEFLKWKGYNAGMFDLDTGLGFWCPKIKGGTDQDQKDIQLAADQYWEEISCKFDIDVCDLYSMTLRDL